MPPECINSPVDETAQAVLAGKTFDVEDFGSLPGAANLQVGVQQTIRRGMCNWFGITLAPFRMTWA